MLEAPGNLNQPLMAGSPRPKYVLGIDLGTGGPKVGLVDQEGKVVSSATGVTQLVFLPNGGAEHDPAEWWSVISNCVKQVIREAGVPAKSIVAVGVTSMWSVTLPVNEHGEPLMNVLSYMDSRGAPYNREIVKGFPNVQGYKLSTLLKYLKLVGLPPGLKGNDALGHILYIKHERPDIYRRTYKFLEPMDYINSRLTGKCAATQNTALALLMTDNRQLNQQEYDPWLLKMSGIDREKLPDLLPIDGILGTVTPAVATELGLSPRTVVICGINDNSSSAIGAGAIDDSEPAAVMGTSGYLTLHVSYKKTDIGHSMGTMPSGLKGRYLFWGELLNNGKVLESFLKNLVYGKDAFDTGITPKDMFDRANQIAAEVPPGSEGVIFLPWFNGSFAPGEDQFMRGGFINLSHKTTRAHLTRAVFEGLSMNWRWLNGPSEQCVGHKFNSWRLTGGGALLDTWSQIMADVVGLPMRQQTDPRNHNVIGMGLLAFNRLGLIKEDDIASKIKFNRVFDPNPNNREIYNQIYKQFISSKDKIKPVFHALNNIKS